MKKTNEIRWLFIAFFAAMLLSVANARNVRFVSFGWSSCSLPFYVPFGEDFSTLVPDCALICDDLRDDEYIIEHSSFDDSFAWTLGPCQGSTDFCTVHTGDGSAPNTISQPGSYTLTFTGQATYYIRRIENRREVLEGPFTANLEVLSPDYTLSRTLHVVDILGIQGHGKSSSHRTASLSRQAAGVQDGEAFSGDDSPYSRDGLRTGVQWLDTETIYAQAGSKVNLSMYITPYLVPDAALSPMLNWYSSDGVVLPDVNDKRNVTFFPSTETGQDS